jgi:hypothetical protein
MGSLSYDSLSDQAWFLLNLAYQYISQPIAILLLVAVCFLAWHFLSPKH